MRLKHGDRVEHGQVSRSTSPPSLGRTDAGLTHELRPGPYTDATKHERCDTAYTAWPAPCMQQPGDPGDKLARWPRRLVGTDVHGEDAGGARHGLR